MPPCAAARERHAFPRAREPLSREEGALPLLCRHHPDVVQPDCAQLLASSGSLTRQLLLIISVSMRAANKFVSAIHCNASSSESSESSEGRNWKRRGGQQRELETNERVGSPGSNAQEAEGAVAGRGPSSLGAASSLPASSSLPPSSPTPLALWPPSPPLPLLLRPSPCCGHCLCASTATAATSAHYQQNAPATVYHDKHSRCLVAQC